ncbi:MAG: class I SAM-dependent methyltransferase [Pirellulales bacterium]|nr:class I SAM-dependent methyltransferase [Pirellulales bacterium]
MFTPDQYQLLDFGRGRRLERFGEIVLDRPCPVAEHEPVADEAAWRSADARYERQDDQGEWLTEHDLPERWVIQHESNSLELKRTPFGHVGLFAEQAENWDWIARRVAAADRPLKVLNLFAYTGGSTLAAASAGAEVTHVDAAKNVVAWARRNAEHSGLADAPIRWITDDATKFVKRELRREAQYDAVILDPPSYGHGARGEVWRLTRHLPRLLELCGKLTAESRALLLLTCHTPGVGAAELEAYLADAIFGHCGAGVRARALEVTSADGRQLPSGIVARWPSH